MIDIGVFRRNGCTFHLRSSSTSPADEGIIYDGYGLKDERTDKPRPWFPDGRGLVPIVGDWTGKGFDSIGVYHDDYSGPKFSLRNSNAPGKGDLEFAYGNYGDIPLVGKWRKGADCIGVYRRSEHKFYLRYSNTSGAPDVVIQRGRGDGATVSPYDVPLVGDWTGKGFDSLGVYRPETRTFYLRHYKGYYPPYPEGKDTVITYGNPGDVPVVGDWTGKGFDSIGVYRPGESKFYVKNNNDPGNADGTVIYYGNRGDIPLVGKWR